jgi:hypothetical protein
MNINGTYRAQNGDFVLTITNSNETNGTFNGTYTATYTEQGQQTFATVTGTWNYVNNPGGSLTPLTIGFTAVCRPDPRPYVIMDSWSGVMSQPGRFSATGTRAYLPGGGPAQLSSLGTQSFGA